MRQFAEREVLILTAITTGMVALLTLFTSQGDWVTTALMLPLVASVSFWSLVVARRVSSRWAPKPPERAAPLVLTPSSERPEHAQRRRQRRTPRGRRSGGEG